MPAASISSSTLYGFVIKINNPAAKFEKISFVAKPIIKPIIPSHAINPVTSNPKLPRRVIDKIMFL